MAAIAFVSGTAFAQDAKQSVTLERFLAPAFPYDLVAARKEPRIAWIENERGARNIFTAAAPGFEPRRLTSTARDDGVDLGSLRISDDGSVVAWIRGHTPVGRYAEMPEWVANPAADPDGGKNEVWAASTSGGDPWLVATARNFALAPDGHSVVYEKNGQIYLAGVTAAAGEVRENPLLRDFGANKDPVWSPDGRKIAYVSVRDDHSFIAVFDPAAGQIAYLAPGVDFDSAPVWSADGEQIAYLRKPGRAFASWTEALPDETVSVLPEGFVEPKLDGGSTLSIRIADVETGTTRELWRTPPGGYGLYSERILWAGDHILFDAEPAGWRHWFSLATAAPEPKPVLLTPGDGEAEHVATSADGRWLYYTSNAGDPDRRHLWRVSTGGGRPEQLTVPPAITTWPAVPGSGEQLAVLHAGPGQPLSVALVPAAGGGARIIAPRQPHDFPADRHVEPRSIVLTAEDGVRSHAQVFLPKDIRPGERRPALLFIHGGPRQQTLLGYHYQAPHGFYHLAYAMSQYFTSRGYVTLSVNYRSGIGYGRGFREAPETGAAGNSEYRDVLAAGLWLREHAQVDPERIGVWGLSYGGMLVTQALARHSDVFAAGVSIGGFALWEYSLDPDTVPFRSSPVAAIDSWRSPVLLIHGDDDRNVDFSYTVSLVQLLRAKGIPHELMVFPNETHYFQVWQRWIDTFQAADRFFERTLGEHTGPKPHGT